MSYLLWFQQNLSSDAPLASCLARFSRVNIVANRLTFSYDFSASAFPTRRYRGTERLLKPGLWSRNSNFGLRLQLLASKFFGSGSRTIWSNENYCFICTTHWPNKLSVGREPEFQTPLYHLKIFGSDSSHPELLGLRLLSLGLNPTFSHSGATAL